MERGCSRVSVRAILRSISPEGAWVVSPFALVVVLVDWEVVELERCLKRSACVR
jgi:hypothetical protein